MDHVSGALLVPEAIKVARKEELKIFVKISVYEKKVPRRFAQGNNVIRTQWIDTSKGDEVSG